MEKIDYHLHYKYVYFNANYNRSWMIDPNEYNAICLRDAESMKDVIVVQTPLQHLPEFIRKAYALCNSQRFNKRIHLPKRIWYPFIFKQFGEKSKPYCFIFASNNLSFQYIKYLRTCFPGCKIVKTHRDLVKIAHQNPEYSEENMNRYFDLRLSYDIGECTEYGLTHFDEIESKIDIEKSPDYPLSDVFFAGQAKDRLPRLIEAYDLFESAGLKCDFYITNVPEDKQIMRKGITYSNKFMSYNEMLYRSVNTRCMFDINQTGAVGYTSRFLEAVMYNKRFITDNATVKETRYYETGDILFFERISDIDPMFINKKNTVDYNYKNEFSPVNLITQIDRELVEMDAKKKTINI